MKIETVTKAREEISSFTDKLGECIVDAFMEDDNVSCDIGCAVARVFDDCTTSHEFDVANNMLTAICGYTVDSLINDIRQKDKTGHYWESVS